MSYGVIGNTSGFEPEESRFEPLWDNKIYCPIDKLAKSLPFEGRIWGFEALSGIKK